MLAKHAVRKVVGAMQHKEYLLIFSVPLNASVYGRKLAKISLKRIKILISEKKVSAGLKLRKQRLGDEYHSAASKKKIGEATLLRWEQYDDDKRRQMIQVLQNNGIRKRTYGPYDQEWHNLSASIRQGQICHRCGRETHLCVHHIIPVSAHGTREQQNLVTLCSSCHRIVEHEGRNVQELTKDWEITQLLIRERLMCIV